MRRLIFAAAAVAALSGAGSLGGTQANAMPMAGGLGAAVGHAPIDQVRVVCERRWNGYRWVRRCYDTGPTYYYGGGPSIYFGGGGRHHHHGHHHGGHRGRH